MTSGAGSHAGRGFRYQDAVGARLIVDAWAGEFRCGGLTPEGLDDFELEGEAGHVFVQVKSRRDRLGCFSAGEAAGFVRDLWKRWSTSDKTRSKLLLVLERAVAKLPVGPDSGNGIRLSPSDPVGRLLADDPHASTLLERTRVVVMTAPMEEAVRLISEKLGCPPLAARIHYGAIADQVGELSDHNGERSPSSFLSLSLSDVERIIDRLSPTISLDNMETALRLGLCEPVDFLEPLDEPDFYNGVDVQPGHLAAGLFAERPEARGRVLDALIQRRSALIVGPSGSGKSGLMWETARTARHTVRWFRVRSSTTTDVPSLLRLADTFRASIHVPVGYVIDDVGRDRADLWDMVVREAARRPDIVVLGSIREEDIFLLSERARVPELRENPDQGLAERIWTELKARGETHWAGWAEAWAHSSGLLLEYVHLLTQGRRLVDVLQEQVDRRLREERDSELQIIRLASATGRAGAALDVERMQAELSLSDEQIGRALKRLIDEHLIRETGEARIGSLHQIRATHLFEIAHRIPPPTITSTISRTVQCVAAEDIESYIARTLASWPAYRANLVQALKQRLRGQPNLREITSALRGLDRGRIAITIEEWLPELERLGIPATQATFVVRCAVAKIEDFGIDRLKPLLEAAKILQAKFCDDDPRPILIQELHTELTALLIVASWADLTEFLAALSGAAIPRETVDALCSLYPDLLHGDLREVQALLETARHISPEVAWNWVEHVGQDALLHRVSAEMPWASKPTLRREPEGLAVTADIFHISDRLQPKIHDEVVALCEQLLALAPSAELVISSAIDPDGIPSRIGEYTLADKRILRTNLPPKALPQRNRRWIAAVAEHVGKRSETDYLATGRDLLDRLIKPLEEVIDGALRGKAYNKQHLDKLESIHQEARMLVQPARSNSLTSTRTTDDGVSDLQHILFHCSADLIRNLINLPERWAASIWNCDEIVEQIDHATQEPWCLIDGVPPALTRLRDLVGFLRLIIGEAGSQNIKATQLFGGIGKKADRKNALRLVAANVEVSVESKLKRLQRHLEQAAVATGFSAKASVRRVNKISGPWPFAEALVVVSVDSVFDWMKRVGTLLESLRKVAGDGRQLIVVPARGSFAVTSLSFSGVSSFFPIPCSDADWLDSLGFRILEGKYTTLFEHLMTALAEVSAIHNFNCATKDRASAEREALKHALADLDHTASEFEALFLGEAARYWEEFKILMENIREGKINFSRIIRVLMRGEVTAATKTEAFLAMRLFVLEFDALTALEV
ncbi:MAG: hypothetical protein P9E88_10780 [Candidatus Competibacter sp.]|nr:hypothetical protein [Candidatus Competibacter sp.]